MNLKNIFLTFPNKIKMCRILSIFSESTRHIFNLKFIILLGLFIGIFLVIIYTYSFTTLVIFSFANLAFLALASGANML